MNKPVTKGQILNDSIYMRYLKYQVSRNREYNSGFQGLGGGENRELLFNEYNISVMLDGQFVGSAIQHMPALKNTTLYTSKFVKRVDHTLSVLTTNKTKEHKEIPGDIGSDYYLDCGDGMTNVCICSNLSNYTNLMCATLYIPQ